MVKDKRIKELVYRTGFNIVKGPGTLVELSGHSGGGDDVGILLLVIV